MRNDEWMADDDFRPSKPAIGLQCACFLQPKIFMMSQS